MMLQEYSTMADKCHCCLKDQVFDDFIKTCTRGSGPFYGEKMALEGVAEMPYPKWTASNSLLKVEYFNSAGESFLLKNARGRHPLGVCFSRTAPMAMLLASEVRMRALLESRRERWVSDARAFLVSSKAA